MCRLCRRLYRVTATCNRLKAELIRRFDVPQTLLWKRAADLWQRKQGTTESVDTYMSAIINLAHKADMKDQKQIVAALLQGF